MTAYLMSNYRTLNRYKVNLSENKSATIHGKIHYKNIPHQFFAYLSGAVSRSWSDILYGTTMTRMHIHYCKLNMLQTIVTITQ